MSWLDDHLRHRRFAQAEPWIPQSSRVLDLGASDGALLLSLGERIGPSVALDPVIVPGEPLGPPHRLIEGYLSDLVVEEPFDVVCALAVLEHFHEAELHELIAQLPAVLAPGGRLVATIPAPFVDRLLDVLIALHLLDGASAHEHHGAQPAAIQRAIEDAGWHLVHDSRFELGLNHLFVFERVEG